MQALALLTDTVPPKSVQAVATKLSRPSHWVRSSLFQSYHTYAALFKVSSLFARKAIERMDLDFMPMLTSETGTFWETAKGWQDFGQAGALCHAAGVAPLYFIVCLRHSQRHLLKHLPNHDFARDRSLIDSGHFTTFTFTISA